MLAARGSMRDASPRPRKNDGLPRGTHRALGVVPGARKDRLGREAEGKKGTCRLALRTAGGALHSPRRGHARHGPAANACQGRAAMLLTRDEIRHGKSFDLLTEAILERDQPRTTDLFFRMIRDGRSTSDALSVVTAAAARFVQVPSHINMRDGQITLINNDHTILGLRTSTNLAPSLPETDRLLPRLQSVCSLQPGHTATPSGGLQSRADLIGWERAHGVYYIGVPHMAVGPLYYAAYDAACVTAAAELPEAGKNLKQANHAPLTPAEVEDMVRLLLEADGQTVWSLITAHLRGGKSIRSLGDAIQIGAAELILRTTVPRQFTDGQHPFDYCTTANDEMRTSDNAHHRAIPHHMPKV